MKATMIFAVVLNLASTSALLHADTIADQYFSKQEPKFTPQERAAIAIGQKWQTGNASSRPFAGADGAINYVYTVGQMQIMCAVLQVCDVALQAGEQVNNLNVGDNRFTVEPAITGYGASQTMHLLIKPLDVGLNTSLVVTTNRRTYHFRLRSSRTEFMPFVSFTYPEESLAKWETMRTHEAKERKDNTIPQTGEYLGNLDFNYDVSGLAQWKPIRVYNDGRKTIIEMPDILHQTEAPALLVIRKDGGLFTEEETQMVNYRLHGNRYIVDTLFDKAILIAGVGSSQEKITITRGAP